ncbi:hypothetical protein [Bacillus cereus]|uniref:hypothetical protein n=1 Tax=Bacillus cereus TaxID=1396 RepID=UPI0007FB5971|nr:hypothetical protein [Bacillus cereus]MCU4733623.1 hypothetical protein [Bacillus cereus]MCU5149241.1 hypothetical protein [Bacillus cereus]MCU5496245.1 hypothetical protein [Bacillus cereus]MCU5639324.1 hypothetical protein [Bacillus cereus]MCU5702269.1 hypothetical protein [Bacillus cereus]
MKKLETDIKKYNELKKDLLQISQCLICSEDADKVFYQDIAINYSKKLKLLQGFLEDTYNIKICQSCKPSDKL